MVEADILIDPDPPHPLEAPDCLRSTLLHEVGHFLGLPHLEAPAVMAPVSRSCDLDLTEADRAALDLRYGAADQEQPWWTQARSTSTCVECARTTWSSWPWASPAPLRCSP